MSSSDISFGGIVLRLVLAVLLVIGTYNPSGYSFGHWIAGPPVGVTPGKVVAVLALLIAWLVCLRTAFIALGKFGVLLGAALFGAVLWLLVDQSWLDLHGQSMIWAVLVVVGLILGIGLSWSLLRAKATGQIEAR